MMRHFIVREHTADRAGWHHDLLLEFNGAYRAWAVPKGVPDEPGHRRLAIQTEVHTPAEATFTGEIKEGYGKGIIEPYEEGEMVLEAEPTRTNILIQLRGDGHKLRGNYVLRHWEGKKWLIWKRA